jgi:hypothetical protein
MVYFPLPESSSVHIHCWSVILDLFIQRLAFLHFAPSFLRFCSLRPNDSHCVSHKVCFIPFLPCSPFPSISKGQHHVGTNLLDTPIPSPENQLGNTYMYQPTITIFIGTDLLETPIPSVEHQLSNTCRHKHTRDTNLFNSTPTQQDILLEPTYWRHQSL